MESVRKAEMALEEERKLQEKTAEESSEKIFWSKTILGGSSY